MEIEVKDSVDGNGSQPLLFLLSYVMVFLFFGQMKFTLIALYCCIPVCGS